MGIIDRYVLMLFVRVFAICLISLTAMFVVGDFVGNLHEFLDYAERQGSLWRVFTAYYGARVPWFFDLTSRVVSLVAAVFTVTWLQRNNEMTALMAAGISRWRVIVPVVGATIGISLLAAANRELTIPDLRDRLSRNAQDWLGERASPLQPRHDHRSDILIGGQHTFANQLRIEKPRFLLPEEMYRLGRQVVAQNAFYQPAVNGPPGGYLLVGVSEPAGLSEVPSHMREGEPVVLTPHDADWLKPDECFVVSDITFSQLEGGPAWRQFASTGELLSGLHNRSLNYGADVRVTIHARLVQPILDVALLFLGLPLVLSRQHRNVFVASGMCVLIVVGFFVVVLTSHSLGMNYLITPALAAWFPLILFVPGAVALSEPLRQ